MMYTNAQQVQDHIDSSQKVVIVQADNPDGDSLGSALALEDYLGSIGKETSLYCGVEAPGYLRYLRGWDRVSQELPQSFDLSVIVDASTMTLFEKAQQTGQISRLAAKPCIVLDHHASVEQVIPFATVMINDGSRASAGELIYLIGEQLGWDMSVTMQEFLMTSILGDTQGLTNQLASAETYRIMGQMVAAGVDRPALEDLRREFGKMPQLIFKYKAKLINATQFNRSGSIATVHVPQADINTYSPLYNPAPLVQNDMLQTSGVRVAVVFKTYDDGRVTGAIRCNSGNPIGADLAAHMGGGGHAFAAGFKDVTGRPFNEIRSECISYASTLLDTLDKETPDEPIQYAYSTD